MYKTLLGVSLPAAGLFVGWVGQGVFGSSPDALWAGLMVASVLGGCAILMSEQVERRAAPLTRRTAGHQG